MANNKKDFGCFDKHDNPQDCPNLNNNNNDNNNFQEKVIKHIVNSIELKSDKEYYKELQDIAISRRGKLITPQYLGMNEKHEWECKEGHRWYAKPSMVKDKPSREGTWCPECNREARIKYTTQDMRDFAKSKDGQFLSDDYLGWDLDHWWKCNHCGLEWEAPPSYVVGSNRWCRRCSQGLKERIVQAFFESLFGRPFLKETRLGWLKKYGYHLDGCNSFLKIAFESHGIQHYRFHPFFHRGNPEEFKKQKERDEYIREKCTENNIIFIEIGYELRDEVLYKIEYDEMEDYIREQLLKYRIIPPNSNRINWREFNVAHPKYYKEVKKIVERKGGKLISPYYIGSKIPLDIDCGKGHIFKATPNNLKDIPSRKGRWCPECGRKARKKYKVKDMEDLAKRKGGKFLGIQDQNDKEKFVKEFLSVDKHHWWQCDVCGKKWSAKPSMVMGTPSYPDGSWCPNCADVKRRSSLKKIGEQNIGKTQQKILKVLKQEGGKFVFEIAQNLDFSLTNVQSALSHLLNRNLVRRKKEFYPKVSSKNNMLYKYYITEEGDKTFKDYLSLIKK